MVLRHRNNLALHRINRSLIQERPTARHPARATEMRSFRRIDDRVVRRPAHQQRFNLAVPVLVMPTSALNEGKSKPAQSGRTRCCNLKIHIGCRRGDGAVRNRWADGVTKGGRRRGSGIGVVGIGVESPLQSLLPTASTAAAAENSEMHAAASILRPTTVTF